MEDDRESAQASGCEARKGEAAASDGAAAEATGTEATVAAAVEFEAAAEDIRKSRPNLIPCQRTFLGQLLNTHRGCGYLIYIWYTKCIIQITKTCTTTPYNTV